MQIMKAQIDTKQAEKIQEMENEIQRLKQLVNNNTTNNTINLVFNDYGKEDMNFLETSEKYKRILSKFLGF